MILTVSGVKFRYNSHPVLEEVSFHLENSRILAVLGVNGAGKSTLLKCMNRVLRPAAGTVLVGERDIQRMRGAEVAKLVGYVPQRHGDEQLTVFDTVLLGRRPYIKWAAAANDYLVVRRVLTAMRLESFAMRRMSELSGGETQKVVIARALAQEPRLLLLDEPTSNLDLKNQIEVMSIVANAVTEQGISAVVAVHDLNLALRFADAFLVLKDGRVHTLADRGGVTAEVIEDVYGVRAVVSEVEGYPVVVPVSAA